MHIAHTEIDDALLQAAERVLTERLGDHVRLGDVERISEPRRRNLLLRCHVRHGPSDAPATVMLKRARQRRYAPDDANSRAAVGLFRDWAGLEFLNELAPEQSGTPVFYGGDRDHGFFLMEDLGGNKDLDHVLTRGYAEQARRGLIRLAELLGRMHAATSGHEARYDAIRDALGPGDRRHRDRLAGHARKYAPRLAHRCEQIGVPVAPGFFQDVDSVASAMADPGGFLTYTHADACPDNCVLVGDRMRLIDYEFGGFRHALLDGVYGWSRFPTCWCVRDIPQDVVNDMENAYRGELVHGCSEAADDRVYFRGVADACAYWMLASLAQLFERALQYGEPKGTCTNRQRLLMRLDAFRQVASRAGHLDALRQTLDRLQTRLQRAWENDTPFYSAFEVPSEIPSDDAEELITAVRNGNTHAVAAQLRSNPILAHARVDDADQTPVLFPAVESKSETIVRLLLESGANPLETTRSGWTVLARACACSTPAVVDLLLNAGADVNARDAWGTLPLYGAIGNGPMMRHLLTRGARADLKAAIDMDRLDVAARIVEMNPEEVQHRFGTGLTLLHDAAGVGDSRLRAIDFLLRHGADINAVTNWGATPLHLAAFHGHLSTVERLIDRGASLEHRDRHGLSPLELAALREHTACADLIQVRTAQAEQRAIASTSNVTVSTSEPIETHRTVTERSKAASHEGLRAIDAFYSSLGGLLDRDSHPLDGLAGSFGR